MGEILIPQIGVMHISGTTVTRAKQDIDAFVKKNVFINPIKSHLIWKFDKHHTIDE